MKHMRDKLKKAPVFFVASLCLLFAAIAISILQFMSWNQERIVEQNQQYLQDAASQSVKNMEEVLENAARSIAIVSRLYELQMDGPEFDYHMLDQMTESSPFDYIRFVSTDGISWSGDGKQVECQDREYYIEGIQGHSGVCYIGCSRFTQGPILIFYAPLYYEGEIIGVVNGVLDTEHIAAKLEGRIFGTSSSSCVCLPDGVIVASSWQNEGWVGQKQDKALFDEGLTDEAMIYAEQVMRTGEACSFRYAGRMGEGNAYMAPLANGEFLFVRTFPSAVNQAIVARANEDGTKLELVMIAIFLIYLLIISYHYIRRNHKLAREKNDLSEIVNSVKRLYRRFVVLDLEKDEYEYLREGDIGTLGLPGTGRYGEWQEAFRVQREAQPGYWSSIADMTVETLRSALTREHWYSHQEYPTPDGRWEHLSLIRLDMDDGPTKRVLGAVEDITDSKNREKEQRRALETAFRAAEANSRAKSEFLSRMSHDIRTPMNAIIGLTAIMGAHLDDQERIVDCLSKITSSSKHLLGLINEVLDMSKIESGKLSLTEERFSLPSLVEDLLNMVRPMAREKEQNLSVRLHAINHEDVVGDSLRLQQVFVNILSNAVKYTGKGGHITMTLTERPSKQPLLGEYEFVFEDDGIGMSEEFQKRIFMPFERADDERVSSVQGTGLGMAITQSIVHLMGGVISVESKQGQGSRFTVCVSLKLQETEEGRESSLSGLPVLVADDDPVACESTCQALDELGMKSEWTLNGQDAVRRVVDHHAQREDFYAVILDWKMPGMDGLQTARAIRSAVGPDVPIIILSAYDWTDIEKEARAAGVTDFIGKPIFKSRLKSVFMSLSCEARRASASHEDSADPLSQVKEKDYSGKRALLVEDNELNQEITKEILEMTGLAVEVADNGKIAVDCVASSPEGYFDIIFMDIQMPVMNGYESSRAIRALPRKDATRIPIVALSANTFSDDVHAAMEASMNQYVGKPLDPNHLVTVLEKWLR